MKVHSVDWQKIEWREVRRGIERKSFSGEGATLALHRLHPGHEILPHSHPHEQIVYIIEGLVDFHVGEEVFRLGAGGVLNVPPGIIHFAEVVGDEEVLNLDVFTPARPEYSNHPSQPETKR